MSCNHLDDCVRYDLEKQVEALQKAIELYCEGEMIPESIIEQCPQHATMLNYKLAKRPVKETEMSHWISVSESLPTGDYDDLFLVTEKIEGYDSLLYVVALFNAEDQSWRVAADGLKDSKGKYVYLHLGFKPTHWMKIDALDEATTGN